MKPNRIDIGAIRRDQIVEAAVAVITEQGLQNLSLSEIEKKAGMSRGQLTYYFPTKEAILLAVFDRLLLYMCQRVGTPDDRPCEQAGGWQLIEHLFHKVIDQGPGNSEFHALQYTFLSQIGHREDFRQRLATLYESWRTNMAEGLSKDHAEGTVGRKLSPRTFATLVQAILHGLAMQATADPAAFDRDEMVDLCLDVLGTYLKTRTRRKTAQVSNGASVGVK